MSHSGVRSLRTKNDVNKLTGEYGGESYYQGVEIRDADVHSSMLPLVNRELPSTYKVYNPVRHDNVRFSEIRDTRFDSDQPYKESDNPECLHVTGSVASLPNGRWKRNNTPVKLHTLEKNYVNDNRIFNKTTPFADFDSTSLVSPIEYAGIEIINGLEYVHRDDNIELIKNIIDPMTVRYATLESYLLAYGDQYRGGIFSDVQNSIVYSYDPLEKSNIYTISTNNFFLDSFDYSHDLFKQHSKIDLEHFPVINNQIAREPVFHDNVISDRIFLENDFEVLLVEGFHKGDINLNHVQMSTGFIEYSSEQQDSISYRGFLR